MTESVAAVSWIRRAGGALAGICSGSVPGYSCHALCVRQRRTMDSRKRMEPRNLGEELCPLDSAPCPRKCKNTADNMAGGVLLGGDLRSSG
jgi:hypothetical protein